MKQPAHLRFGSAFFHEFRQNNDPLALNAALNMTRVICHQRNPPHRGAALSMGVVEEFVTGRDADEALERSDRICSALQLINFWQDLSRDLPRQRCYLPADALRLRGHFRCMRNEDDRVPPARQIPQQRHHFAIGHGGCNGNARAS